jgi:hypothetical protein
MSCVNDPGQFLGLLIMQRLLRSVVGEGFERGAVAEGGVQPLPVVEDLDVVGNGEPRLDAGREGLPCYTSFSARQRRIRRRRYPSTRRFGWHWCGCRFPAKPREFARGVLGWVDSTRHRDRSNSRCCETS